MENYLAGRPLIAGPESARYRARKFLRRNKGRVVVAAVLGVVIVASVAVSTWQAVRLRAEQMRTLAEKREADRKRQQAEAAEAATAEVNRFLNDMLRSVQPNNAQGRQVLVLDVLNMASNSLDRRFATQPEVERQLRSTVAQTLVTLGKTNLALPHFQREVELSERLYGRDSTQTFGATKAVSDTLYQLGRVAESERMLRELIVRAPQVPGRGAREIMHLKADLAMRLSVLGRNAEAEQAYRETLDEHVRALGPSSPQTLHTLAAYGSFLVSRGSPARGESMLREALVTQRDVLGEDNTQTLWTADAHARALITLGHDAEAETLLRDTIARARKVLVESDSLVTRPIERLSLLLTTRGRHGEAEVLLRGHHEALVSQFGPDEPPAVAAAIDLARVQGWSARPRAAALLDAGRFADAEGPLLEYRRTLLTNGQNTYPEMRWALESLARVYDRTARPARAARARDELAALAPATRPTSVVGFPATLPAAGTWSAEFVDAANWEAYRLRVARRPADSAALRRRVVAEAKRLMPPGHPLLLKYQNALADVLVEAKLLDEAEAQLRDAYEGLLAADADEAMLHSQINRLVKLYVLMENPAAAATWKSKLSATQAAFTASTRPTTTRRENGAR